MTQAYSKGSPAVLLTRVRYHLPIHSDVLPLSYKRFANKLGSCDVKHPACCWDLKVNVWYMCNGINVMVYFLKNIMTRCNKQVRARVGAFE